MTRTPATVSPRVRRLSAWLANTATRVRELFPWTGLGVAVALAAALGLRFLAFDQLDLVFLVVGYAALGLFALGTLSVVITALWLALRPMPDLDATRAAETGADVETRFSLSSLWWAPLVQLDWSWLAPAVELEHHREAGRLHEQVRFQQRGEFRGVTRRFVVQDAFGLSRIAIRRKDPRGFDVLPHVGALRSVPTLASLSGGDDLPHPHGEDAGDRIELARYVPGDPARLIHWKIFGRTGKLMVRRPERALAPARRVAAFLVVGEQDEAAAATVRVAVERRMFGNDWLLGADVAPSGTSDVRRALEIVVRSPQAQDISGTLMDAFFARASLQGPVHAVAFVPPVTGSWLPHVQAVGRARRLHVVIATDGVSRGPRPSLLRRLLFQAPSESVVSTSQLDHVIAELSRAGCVVSVVDRVAGHVLGERHLTGMRAFAAVTVAGAA